MKREVASLRIRSIGKLQATQTGNCSKHIANYRQQWSSFSACSKNQRTMNTDCVPLHKFIYKVMQRFTVKYLIFVRRIPVFSCCSKRVFTSLFNTQRRGKVLSHYRQRICAIPHIKSHVQPSACAQTFGQWEVCRVTCQECK
jgi:hypothetical protein